MLHTALANVSLQQALARAQAQVEALPDSLDLPAGFARSLKASVGKEWLRESRLRRDYRGALAAAVAVPWYRPRSVVEGWYWSSVGRTARTLAHPKTIQSNSTS
jgi:hypothetical protein